MDEYIDTASREQEIFSREYGNQGHQEEQIHRNRSNNVPHFQDRSGLEEYNRHPNQQNEYESIPTINREEVIYQQKHPLPYYQTPIDQLSFEQQKPSKNINARPPQQQNFKRNGNVNRTRSKPQNQNLDAIKLLKNNFAKEISTPTPKSKEETIKINLDQFSKKVDLENVIEIEFLKLDIKNVDYIINETNNLLTIDSKPIIISPGNYTPEQLIHKLNEVCETVVFTICEYDNKVTCSKAPMSIDGEVVILEPEFSTLLDCLGCGNISGEIVISKDTPYTFVFPIKLLKKSVLDIVMYINESDIILDESVLFNTNGDPIDINTTKKFNSPVSIETIDIEFKNYNTRNYPFALFIKVKKLVG